jgi:hypothetical protein
MPSEWHEGLRFILSFIVILGLLFALGWAWRHRVRDTKTIQEPLQAPQWLKGWLLAGLGLGGLFALIVNADDEGGAMPSLIKYVLFLLADLAIIGCILHFVISALRGHAPFERDPVFIWGYDQRELAL